MRQKGRENKGKSPIFQRKKMIMRITILVQ